MTDAPEKTTLAAIVAAPIWAFVWVLTLGRFGRPLWRARMRGAMPKPRPPLAPGVVKTSYGYGYQPTHGGDSSNPPQSGSGLTPIIDDGTSDTPDLPPTPHLSTDTGRLV